MKKLRMNFINSENGFSLIEIIIVLGMISVLSSIAVPNFINWIRSEQVNSYTRELKEFLRVVKLESRRWGSICRVEINRIPHNGIQKGEKSSGFTIKCDDPSSRINSLSPSMNNSIFQISNKNFLITPNGRISSEKSIVIVIGSQYFFSGAKLLNCLVIESPTGHIKKGIFQKNDWISKGMSISQIDQNNLINSNQCRSS